MPVGWSVRPPARCMSWLDLPGGAEEPAHPQPRHDRVTRDWAVDQSAVVVAVCPARPDPASGTGCPVLTCAQINSPVWARSIFSTATPARCGSRSASPPRSHADHDHRRVAGHWQSVTPTKLITQSAQGPLSESANTVGGQVDVLVVDSLVIRDRRIAPRWGRSSWHTNANSVAAASGPGTVCWFMSAGARLLGRVGLVGSVSVGWIGVSVLTGSPSRGRPDDAGLLRAVARCTREEGRCPQPDEAAHRSARSCSAFSGSAAGATRNRPRMDAHPIR
jgi:hypothetical protein